MSLALLFCYIFLWFKFINSLQSLQLSDDKERSERGKSILEKFKKDKKFIEMSCWEEALMRLSSSCRDMNDIEQSYLALQFSNCHLKKSGLKVYPCQISNFKECTQEMGSDIIAFQSYTEFFTHVSDICFYMQSAMWREKTESTINKLSKSSAESLEVLSQSILQQQQVLQSQKESLQNQKEILENEIILKEVLVSSAQSAKDVFQEVREQAQQQKTMFSETFDAIFQSVERLTNLQTVLLGEFISLQSVAFYLVATVVCYLFTSAPRTYSARLPLFVSLSLLIICERFYVKWAINEISKQDINSVCNIYIKVCSLQSYILHLT